METVQKEIDKILLLLRSKIKERGFTQLEVQDALGWGRSYISQLLTKQKTLRVDQVLLVLNVIGVEPADFYGEIYPRFGPTGYSLSPSAAQAPYDSQAVHQDLEELRTALHGLIRTLIDNQLIHQDELPMSD